MALHSHYRKIIILIRVDFKQYILQINNKTMFLTILLYKCNHVPRAFHSPFPLLHLVSLFLIWKCHHHVAFFRNISVSIKLYILAINLKKKLSM